MLSGFRNPECESKLVNIFTKLGQKSQIFCGVKLGPGGNPFLTNQSSKISCYNPFIFLSKGSNYRTRSMKENILHFAIDQVFCKIFPIEVLRHLTAVFRPIFLYIIFGTPICSTSIHLVPYDKCRNMQTIVDCSLGTIREGQKQPDAGCGSCRYNNITINIGHIRSIFSPLLSFLFSFSYHSFLYLLSFIAICFSSSLYICAFSSPPLSD